MPIIDFNPLFGLPLPEANPADQVLGTASPDAGELFNDYLQRAKSSADANGRQDESNTADEGGRSPAPRVEQSQSTNPSTSNINEGNRDDDADAAEPADSADPAAQQELKSEVEKKSVEKAADDSRIARKSENKKKNLQDGQDSISEENSRDNQTNLHVNPDAANVKTDSKSANDALSAKADAVDIACKGAKNISGGEALQKAAPATERERQNAVAEQTDAADVQSAKVKALQNPAQKSGENAGELLSGLQNAESISASVKNNISAEKPSKAASRFARDVRHKMSQQSEKKQTSGVGEALGAPDFSKDAALSAPAEKAAAIQAVVDLPTATAKSTEKDVDISGGNAAGKNKTDMPANAQAQSGSASKAAAEIGRQGGNESGTHVDLARFAQRVERAFAAIGDRGGSVRLKLSPPELGSIRVEISVHKGVMRARLEAETKETKNLLLENLPGLRDRLAQQNIKIQQFDVDLRDPSSGGMSQQTANQADTGSSGGDYRNPQSQSQDKNGAVIPAPAAKSPGGHSGQLNVIV